MSIITAIIIGLLIVLAYCVLYYLVVCKSIRDMKRTVWHHIKTFCMKDFIDFLSLWFICSVILFVVVNVCGLLLDIFDMNFLDLFSDWLFFDPLE